MRYNKDSYKVDIFIINEDGDLVINKKEIKEIKEYKDIFIKNGKNNSKSHKELLYIYLMLNPASMYIDIPASDRADKVIAHCDFNEDWFPDDIVLKAMERYNNIDLKLSGLMYSYLAAKNNLYNYGKDIDYINNRNKDIREELSIIDKSLNNSSLEEEIEELKNRKDFYIDELLKNNEKANKMILNLNKAHDIVETLEKKVIEENSKKDNIYGGGTLGNREE